MKLCLISEAEPVRAAVRACCLPPHQVEVFGLDGFLAPDNTLSDYGTSVVQAARQADAVLIGWSLERAPLINTIAFAVRAEQTFVPVIALCGGGQGEMIAALAAGVDDVTSFPLYLPLFQARIVSHRRLVEAVRRASARRVKKKLKKKAKTTTHAEIGTEPFAGPLIAALEDRVETTGADRQKSSARASAGDGRAAEAPIETVAEGLIEKYLADGLAEQVAEALVEAVDTELILIDPEQDIMQVGSLRLNRTAYRVHMGDDEVDLTPKEFELLAFFIEHAGHLCTRDQILDTVWGIDFETGTNMVDVYMHFLRKKLAAHGLGGTLQTVRGRGYRLAVSEAEAA